MNLNKNSIKKLVLIFLICAADILWSAGFIYLWKTKGVVLSVKEASVNIPGIFVQNLIVEAVPAGEKFPDGNVSENYRENAEMHSWDSWRHFAGVGSLVSGHESG